MKLKEVNSSVFSSLNAHNAMKENFLERKVYDLSAFTKVRKSCPACKMNYHMEPSFYYGSMYVAYALGVGLMVSIILLNLLFSSEFSFLRTFWMICVALISLAPLLNAWAKIIWANFFFHFKTEWKSKSK